jgi:hypothetical protein
LVSESEERAGQAKGPFWWWRDLPLYLRILVGLVLGIVAGLLLGPSAKGLDLPARLIPYPERRPRSSQASEMSASWQA